MDEDFFKTASFEDGLRVVALMGTGMHKQGAGFMDTLKSYWENPEVRQALMHTGVGMGAGALAGGASTLFEPEERRRPLSRAMTGALLGGLGGAGLYGLRKTIPNVVRPQGPGRPPAEIQSEIDDLSVSGEAAQERADAGTFGNLGGGTANVVMGIGTGKPDRVGEGLQQIGSPTYARWNQISSDAVDPDTGFLDHPALPEVAGAGAGVAGYFSQRGVNPSMTRMLAGEKATGGAAPNNEQLEQLRKIRQDLVSQHGMSQRAAQKRILQEGGAAADNAANAAAKKTHEALMKDHAKALEQYQKDLAQHLQRETIKANSIRTLRKQVQDALARGDRNAARQAQRMLNRATSNKLPKKPAAPTAPKMAPTAASGSTIRPDDVRLWLKGQRKPGFKGRLSRAAIAAILTQQLTQALQNSSYGTSDKALTWQAQDLAAQEAAARAAAK